MNDQWPIVSTSLMIIIALISFGGINNYRLIELFRHYPYEEKRNHSYFRWITCGFVHGSYMHLLLNVFVLWQFGFIVENIYVAQFGPIQGNMVYLIIYILILSLTCIPSFIKYKDNPSYASIGASGAISGLLFIYIYFYPWSTLYYIFIPMPAIALGVLYLIYSWWAAKNTNDGIDHGAHYYGAIIGVLIAYSLDHLV